MTLPTKPVKGPEETDAIFNDRMLNWWRECDVTIRERAVIAQEKQVEACTAFQTQVGPSIAPTLDRLADAWDGLDTALEHVATALQTPTTSTPSFGLSPEFVLSILRLVLDKDLSGSQL